MSKYKPGQIVTLKDGNTRYVCKIIKSELGCARCDFYRYTNYPSIAILFEVYLPFCNGHCYNILDKCAYKLIRKYVVEKEKRSNASTKD